MPGFFMCDISIVRITYGQIQNQKSVSIFWASVCKNRMHPPIKCDSNLKRSNAIKHLPFSLCDPCVARNLQIRRETLKKHLHSKKNHTTISGA